MRHEVEQEQWRLSCYQSNQGDGSSRNLVTRLETRVSDCFPSSKDHKSHVQAKKYVVDSSKPRTDLEYDPLSNFSAALNSYSSSSRDHKVKNRQDGNSSKSVDSAEKQSTPQSQMYQPPSLEILDDSTEDGVLVIDVSLSPDKGSDRSQNASDSQDPERDSKEIKSVKVFFESQPQKIKTKVVKAAAASTSSAPDCCPVESDPVVSTSDKMKDYMTVDGRIIDLSGCLEELVRECENASCQFPDKVKKMTEPESFSTSDQAHPLSNPQIEPNCDAEKNNSLFCKRPDPTSRLMRPAPKQASKTDQIQSHFSCVQDEPSVVREVEKTATKTNLKAFANRKRAEEGSSQIRSLNGPPVNPHGRAESPESNERLLQEEEDETVIVINSSPEREDELNYSDMELSDSDPMEECYRIFMEANNNEKGNEEQCGTSVSKEYSFFYGVKMCSITLLSFLFQIGADVEVEKPEANSTAQTLTGKKRVAHEARHLEVHAPHIGLKYC